MTDTTDLERRVHDYVDAAFEAVPATTATEVLGRRPSGRARRWWPVAVAAALVVVLMVVGIGVMVRDRSSDSRVGAGHRRIPVVTDTDPTPLQVGEWTVDLGGEVPYPPVLAADVAVVVSATPDFSRTTLHVLDAATGAERWQRDLGSQVAAVPVAAGDLVLVRTVDERLVALDATDGTERWSAETGKNVKGPPAPVVADDTVYVGSQDGLVQALALATGAPRWRRRLEGAVVASPTPVRHGLLVPTAEMPVGSGGGALSVLDDRGRVVDRESSRLPVVTSPAGTRGLAAFTTYQLDPGFTPQVDPTALVITGRARHRYPGNLSAPVVTDGYVAAASDVGILRAYDARDPQRRLWSARVGDNQAPQLAVARSRLIVTGSELIAVDPQSGHQIWHAPVSDAYLGESRDPRRVVAMSRTTGSLAVVDVRDGSLVADYALHDAPTGAVLADGSLVWASRSGRVTRAVLDASAAALVECARTRTSETATADGLPERSVVTNEAYVRGVLERMTGRPYLGAERWVVMPAHVRAWTREPDGAVTVDVVDGWEIVVTLRDASYCPSAPISWEGVPVQFFAPLKGSSG